LKGVSWIKADTTGGCATEAGITTYLEGFKKGRLASQVRILRFTLITFLNFNKDANIVEHRLARSKTSTSGSQTVSAFEYG